MLLSQLLIITNLVFLDSPRGIGMLWIHIYPMKNWMRYSTRPLLDFWETIRQIMSFVCYCLSWWWKAFSVWGHVGNGLTSYLFFFKIFFFHYFWKRAWNSGFLIRYPRKKKSKFSRKKSSGLTQTGKERKSCICMSFMSTWGQTYAQGRVCACHPTISGLHICAKLMTENTQICCPCTD